VRQRRLTSALHALVIKSGADLERRFQLADFVEAGEASFAHGLLTIALKRVVPEAMKPRKIAIAGISATTLQIEGPRVQAREAA
jgi:molecular chaperone IbpA